MVWSSRLRGAGLDEHCAVLGIAADEERPAVERVRAAAVAGGAFRDPRAPLLVEVAAQGVADDEIPEIMALGRQIAEGGGAADSEVAQRWKERMKGRPELLDRS